MSAKVTIPIPEWLDKICVWPLMLYRRVKFGEPFRKIDLGEGEYTFVGPSDYYALGKYKWIFYGGGRKAYAVREGKIGPNTTKRIYLHREIVKPRKGKLVDHWDNDSFNNLRSNLREATYSQNLANRSKTKSKTTSSYRGVSFCKLSRKWVAAIGWRHKHIQLGRYQSEVEAARVYDIAAIKYYKDFARTNFPREEYVKTGKGYKYIGDEKAAEICCQGRTRIGKICLSILSCFGKRKKGRNYERDTVRRRPVRKGR